jgi:6-phosphofructo-2-kinase/fructose-2,6-biphosphatase 2
MTYTINLTISPKRNIYLSRHGESEYNREDRLGGNSELSEKGQKYAKALPIVLNQLIKNEEERENLTILTSTLQRTINTGKFIKINEKEPIELRILD